MGVFAALHFLERNGGITLGTHVAVKRYQHLPLGFVAQEIERLRLFNEAMAEPPDPYEMEMQNLRAQERLNAGRWVAIGAAKEGDMSNTEISDQA